VADVMYINDIPFLTSILENINYRTMGIVDNLKCPHLELEIKSIVRSYLVHRFRIVIIIVDIQFKILKDRNLVSIPFNVILREEHIYKIKKYHRVVQE